jgi:hypothetical protein
MDITEFRAQYPQYNDMDDASLSQSLHQKFYSDMAYDDFAGKFLGAKPPAPVAAAPTGAPDAEFQAMRDEAASADPVRSNGLPGSVMNTYAGPVAAPDLSDGFDAASRKQRKEQDTIDKAAKPSGSIRSSDYDFQSAKDYAPGTGDNPLKSAISAVKRGEAKASSAVHRNVAGVYEAFGDAIGNASLSRFASDSAEADTRKDQAIDSRPSAAPALEKGTQMALEFAPYIVAGAATAGMSLGLPLASQVALGFTSTYGSAYHEGRQAGLDGADAGQRAYLIALANGAANGIKAPAIFDAWVKKAPDIATQNLLASFKEFAAPLLLGNAAGINAQLAVDNLPGIGISPLTFNKFVDGLKETVNQTVLQGALIAGTHGAAHQLGRAIEHRAAGKLEGNASLGTAHLIDGYQRAVKTDDPNEARDIMSKAVIDMHHADPDHTRDLESIQKALTEKALADQAARIEADHQREAQKQADEQAKQAEAAQPEAAPEEPAKEPAPAPEARTETKAEARPEESPDAAAPKDDELTRKYNEDATAKETAAVEPKAPEAGQPTSEAAAPAVAPVKPKAARKPKAAKEKPSDDAAGPEQRDGRAPDVRAGETGAGAPDGESAARPSYRTRNQEAEHAGKIADALSASLRERGQTRRVSAGDVRFPDLPREHQQFLEAVHDAIGVRSHVVDVDLAGLGDGFSMRGSPKDIYISHKAITEGVSPVHFIVGHEVIHSLQKTHPDLYAKLLGAMAEHYKDSGLADATLLHARQDDKSIPAKQRAEMLAFYEKDRGDMQGSRAEEESIADFSGRQWMSKGFLTRIAEKHPELFGAIAKHAIPLLDKIIAAGKKLTRPADWFKQSVELRDVYDDVMHEWAARNKAEREANPPGKQAVLDKIEAKKRARPKKKIAVEDPSAVKSQEEELEDQHERHLDETSARDDAFAQPQDVVDVEPPATKRRRAAVDRAKKKTSFTPEDKPVGSRAPYLGRENSHWEKVGGNRWQRFNNGEPTNSYRTDEAMRFTRDAKGSEVAFTPENEEKFSAKPVGTEIPAVAGGVWRKTGPNMWQRSQGGKTTFRTDEAMQTVKGAQHEVAFTPEGDTEKFDPYSRGSGWYKSALEQHALKQAPWAKDETLPPGQLLSYLQSRVKSGDIKKDEWVWSGLEDYLKGAPGRVTKDNVGKYLRDEAVQVKDIIYSTRNKTPVEQELSETRASDRKRAVDKAMQEIEQRTGMTREEIENDWGYSDEREYIALAASLRGDEVRQSDINAMYPDPSGDLVDNTRHSSWQLPGGDDYHELLVTLPYRESDYPFHADGVIDKLNEKYGVKTTQIGRGTSIEPAWHNDQLTAEERKELADAVAKDRAGNEKRIADTFTHNHWADDTGYQQAKQRVPNVLVHLRFNIRTDSNGKRVMFLEELQSDWGQTGRKYGFRSEFDADSAKLEELAKQSKAVEPGSEEWVKLDKQIRAIAQKTYTTPEGPFVGKTEHWTALGLKRAIAWAAKHDIERIAWTNGEQQNARYGLSQKVDRISLMYAERDRPDAGYSYNVWSKESPHSVITSGDHVTLAQLAAVIGKDRADHLGDMLKRNATDRYGVAEMSGKDLDIGGDGMRKSYDEIIPQAAGQLLRKIGGGKVDVSRIPTEHRPIGDSFHDIPDYSEAQLRELLRSGDLDYTLSRQVRDILEGMDDMNEGEQFQQAVRYYGSANLVRKLGGTVEHTDGFKHTEQQGFDITPKMREIAGEGLPLFTPENPKAAVNSRFHITEPSALQEKDRQFLNRHNRIEEIQNLIAAHGGTIRDSNNVALALERMPGRTDVLVGKFYDHVLDPIIKDAAKSGVNLNEAMDLAMLMHAGERNRVIGAKRPNDMPDGASGITNAQAALELREYRASPDYRKILKVAKQIQAITKNTLTMMEREGLIAPSERAAMEGAYKRYVPLRGTDDPGDIDMSGEGRFVDIRGKELDRATGRYTRADPTQILSNIVQDRIIAIVRAEKNRIGKYLMQLVQDNPDPKLWSIDRINRVPRIVKDAAGNEEIRMQDEVDRGPSTIVTKVGGQEFAIHIKDDHLLNALSGMNDSNLSTFEKAMGAGNRMVTKFWTQYNPYFAARNAVRDAMTGAVHMLAEQGIKHTGRTAELVPISLRAMYMNLRGQDHSKFARVNTMLQYVREFTENGGKTGYVERMGAEDRMRSIEATWDNAANRRVMRKGAKAFLEWVSDSNGAIENAIRVAHYRALREAGKSIPEAVSSAKNLTVNFNRRGDFGPNMNALFLFYNPSMQGTSRIYQAIKKAPKAMAGLLAAQVGLGYALAAMSVQDADEDGIPYWYKPQIEQLKQRALVYVLPGTGGKYISMPLPYGYNAFFNLGYALHDMQMKRKTPTRVASELLSTMFMAFSPMAGNLPEAGATAMLPTVAQPPIRISANQGDFGNKILPGDDNKPDSERYKPSSRGEPLQRATDWLNQATGGDHHIPGGVSVSPETLSYVYRFVLGGVGQFMADGYHLTQQIIYGNSVEPDRRPFVKDFYGEHEPEKDGSLFYDRVRDLKRVVDSYKEAEAAGDESKTGQLGDRYGTDLIVKGGEAITEAQNALKELKDQEATVRASDDPPGLKQLQLREIGRERGKVYQTFNGIINEQNNGKLDIPVPPKVF